MANAGHAPNWTIPGASHERERMLNTVEGRAHGSYGRIAVIVGVSRDLRDGAGPTSATVNRAVRIARVSGDGTHDVRTVANLQGTSADANYGMQAAAWVAVECDTPDAYDRFMDALRRVSRDYPGADIAVTTGAHYRITDGAGPVATYTDPL